MVKGRAGIGKTTLLRQLHRLLKDELPCFWLANTNAKAAVFDLAEQVHRRLSLQVPERFIPERYRARAHQTGLVEWAWIKRTLSRAPMRETADLLLASLRGRGAIVFLEALEVAPTQAELYHDLAEVAQLAAAMDEDNRRVRIQRLLWRFQKTLELKPLTRSQSKELVERWLERRPIRFSSDRVRQAFVRAVVQDSGGVSAAIAGMLQAAGNDGEVTPASIRAYRHEAGTRYLDMTPALVLLVIGCHGHALCLPGYRSGGTAGDVRGGLGPVLWAVHLSAQAGAVGDVIRSRSTSHPTRGRPGSQGKGG